MQNVKFFCQITEIAIIAFRSAWSPWQDIIDRTHYWPLYQEEMGFFMSPIQLLLIILPLGLDTLGISLSLGMKSLPRSPSGEKEERRPIFPYWLRSATLFSLAEMLMPVLGLVVGHAATSLVSDVMRYIGPILLIGVG